MPEPVLAVHSRALGVALDDPTVRSRFIQFAARIPEGEERQPDALARVMANDGRRWGELLSAASIGKE